MRRSKAVSAKLTALERLFVGDAGQTLQREVSVGKPQIQIGQPRIYLTAVADASAAVDRKAAAGVQEGGQRFGDVYDRVWIQIDSKSDVTLKVDDLSIQVSKPHVAHTPDLIWGQVFSLVKQGISRFDRTFSVKIPRGRGIPYMCSKFALRPTL